MKRFAVLGAVIAALTFAAPANAADVPVRGPIYKAAPAPVYNWTGFYIGAHIGYGWGDANLGFQPDGFLGGIQAGYNWHLNRNWVFGIEGDFSATDMNDTVLGLNVHVDYLASIRGRVGYTWDRMMLYGTGGVAFTRVGALGVHATNEGWVLGAGLEWAFSHRWTAKVEYLFYDIDAFETSALKFGVNYRF
jgi:outer membrane immunogenic protein